MHDAPVVWLSVAEDMHMFKMAIFRKQLDLPTLLVEELKMNFDDSTKASIMIVNEKRQTTEEMSRTLEIFAVIPTSRPEFIIIHNRSSNTYFTSRKVNNEVVYDQQLRVVPPRPREYQHFWIGAASFF
jgi:predicted RND superfamily exporter protein